ncbi:MAG: hypothetical protein MUF34_34810, partial [Polyangiaceae bacterium]|nr:hypothetical protein [Polyangiaceae bacterium]
GDAKQRLLDHAYATQVGPWLAREQRQLHAETRHVLFFWNAVRAMSDWLYGVVTALRSSGDGPARWQEAARALRAEVRLECELREPGWSEPVRLIGVADAVLTLPKGRRPCVVEFKLGGQRPAVDLGQAALYRLLAERSSPGDAPASMALVRFSPKAEETLLEADDLAGAEENLLRVIGRLAGVDGSPRSLADVDGSPRSLAGVDGSPRSLASVDGSPRSLADVDGSPRSFAVFDAERTPLARPAGATKTPADRAGTTTSATGASRAIAAATGASMADESPLVVLASVLEVRPSISVNLPALTPLPAASPSPVLSSTDLARASSSKAEPTAPPQARTNAERPSLALGERLQRALREHVPDVQVIGEPSIGPRFVRYELRLGRGGKVAKIKAVAPEVGLRLSLAKEPIVMHASGRLTVDVARDDPETLPFSFVRGELEAQRGPAGSSRMPIGVDLGGKLHFADLADPSSAHALVAGTTGSGKTEWLRTAIAGLLLANTPDTIRLVLIDPKRVAFSDLRRSPFLWKKSAFWDNSGEADVVELLEALVNEMDRRYGLLAEAGVDHLLEFASKTGDTMPRLVCFCDEYFALLTQGDSNQEKAVKRFIGLLGAKGRAAGVHLVLATQQPSRQVVSGPIDANIPCRVGLMMANPIDSRMIIQTAGAEKLTGLGDLLYKSIGDPVRLQSPYLTSEERARIFGGS